MFPVTHLSSYLIQSGNSYWGVGQLPSKSDSTSCASISGWFLLKASLQTAQDQDVLGLCIGGWGVGRCKDYSLLCPPTFHHTYTHTTIAVSSLSWAQRLLVQATSKEEEKRWSHRQAVKKINCNTSSLHFYQWGSHLAQFSFHTLAHWLFGTRFQHGSHLKSSSFDLQFVLTASYCTAFFFYLRAGR